MKINEYNLIQLIQGIKDPIVGTEWVTLLDSVGFKDVYDNGLPDIGKPNGQRPSKKEYLKKRFLEINGTENLRAVLERLINSHPEFEHVISDNIKDDGYRVLEEGNKYVIVSGCPQPTQQVRTEAYFENIEKQVINDLDNARVSIHVAMAWFTNQRIADKLIEKHNQGLDVEVVTFDDHTNAKCGVDLADILHKSIRGTRGGTMHDKFCIIDNQKVITGSYNWSANAESKNDENAAILYDNDRVSDYSVEFRKLFKDNNI